MSFANTTSPTKRFFYQGILFRWICAILLLLASCRTYTQQITGKLENYSRTSFNIRYSPDVITMSDDTVHVNEKGEFKFRFKMGSPAIVKLFLVNGISQEIFIAPALSLNIKADVSNKENFNKTLGFSGTAANYNRYYQILQLSEKFHSVDYYNKFDSFLKLPENEKIAMLKAYKFTKDSIRQRFVNDIKKDKLVLKFIYGDSMETQYMVLNSLISIANQLKSIDERMNFITQNIRPYMTDINDPIAISGWWFRFTWNLYAHRMYFDAKAKGDTISPASTNEFERRFSDLDRYVKSPLLIEMMYGQWYLSGMTSQYKFLDERDFPSWDSAFTRMSIRVHSDELINKFKQTIEDNKALVLMSKKGETAPAFILIDSSGKTYRLHDFSNKVLVLDIWASWCTPCIEEFPKMKKLGELFLNRNDITFINVSVDNFKNDWLEKGLRRFSPPGISLWAVNGSYSNFYKDYKIATLPHIIVLDKNGRFVEYSAPYPSEGDKLEKLIITTLQQ